MQTQKTVRAAAGAAGASGGARQQKPPREWYTIVVYEKRHVKKVLLYVGRETFTFKVPVGINIGNIAVIIKRWRVSDKTVACSASIHIVNLAKLLQEYAREEAEKAGILSQILREAEKHLAKVMSHADGAQPEAAAGAGGGPAQQTNWAPRQRYMLVVYEGSQHKTAVLHLGGGRVFVFRLPVGVEIRRLGVIIKEWQVGRTLAYSMSIHVANLAMLLRKYARGEAESAGILEPILREAEELSEVIAHADGAQPSVTAVTPREVCSKVADVVSDMRSDGYLAVRIDELVDFVNTSLSVEEKEGRQEVVVTVEDVKRCLRLDDTVRIIGDRSGEAVWLWGGSYMFLLADKASKMALKYGAVLMEAEECGENAAAAL